MDLINQGAVHALTSKVADARPDLAQKPASLPDTNVPPSSHEKLLDIQAMYT